MSNRLSDSDICVYRSPDVRKAQYKELIDKFPIGILVWHLEDESDEKSFKCLSANRAAETMTYLILFCQSNFLVIQ